MVQAAAVFRRPSSSGYAAVILGERLAVCSSQIAIALLILFEDRAVRQPRPVVCRPEVSPETSGVP